MKTRFLFLLCLTLLVRIGRAESASATSPSAKISVRLSLDAEGGASRGDAEIVGPGGTFRRQFRGGQLRVELAPAEYRLRVRGLDERGVPGEWSEPQDFVVKPTPPHGLRASPATEISAEIATKKAKVTLTWISGRGGRADVVDVVNSETGEHEAREVTGGPGVWELPPGEYAWSVTTIAESGVKSTVIPGPVIRIRGPQIPRPEVIGTGPTGARLANGNVLAEMLRGRGRLQSRMEFRRHESDTWTSKTAPELALTELLTWPRPPEAGLYRLTLVASAPAWVDSETAVTEFEVKARPEDLGLPARSTDPKP